MGYNEEISANKEGVLVIDSCFLYVHTEMLQLLAHYRVKVIPLLLHTSRIV
jgi:hypothetical protein